jgi:hypothetical protein
LYPPQGVHTPNLKLVVYNRVLHPQYFINTAFRSTFEEEEEEEEEEEKEGQVV